MFNPFAGTPKDIITNIGAIVVVIVTAIQTYIQTIPGNGGINWLQMVIQVGVALGLWFTGKSGSGTPKVV